MYRKLIKFIDLQLLSNIVLSLSCYKSPVVYNQWNKFDIMKNQQIQSTLHTIISRHREAQADVLYLKAILIEQQEKTLRKIAKYKNKYREAININVNQSPPKRLNSPGYQIKNAKSKQKRVDDNKQDKGKINIPSNIFMDQFFDQVQTIKEILHKFVHQTNEATLRNKLLSLYKIYSSSLDQTRKNYEKQRSKYTSQDIYKNSTAIKEHLLEELKRQIERRKLMQQKLKKLLASNQQSLIQKNLQIKKLKQKVNSMSCISSPREVLKQNNSNIDNSKIANNFAKLLQPSYSQQQNTVNVSQTDNLTYDFIVPSQIVDQSRQDKNELNITNNHNSSKIHSKLGHFYNANQSVSIGKLIGQKQIKKQTIPLIIKKTMHTPNKQHHFTKDKEQNQLQKKQIAQLKKTILKYQDQANKLSNELKKLWQINSKLANQNFQMKGKIKINEQSYADLENQVSNLYNQFQAKLKQNNTQTKSSQKVQQIAYKRTQQRQVQTQQLLFDNVPKIINNFTNISHQSQHKNDEKQKNTLKINTNVNAFQSSWKNNHIQASSPINMKEDVNLRISYQRQSKKAQSNNLGLPQTQQDKIIAQAEFALSRIQKSQFSPQKHDDFGDLSIIPDNKDKYKAEKSMISTTKNQSYFSSRSPPESRFSPRNKQNNEKIQQKVRFSDQFQKQEDLLKMIFVQAITIQQKIQQQGYDNQFLMN